MLVGVVYNEVLKCRLGTQPKGIGDATGVGCGHQGRDDVSPRHSAERHWRRNNEWSLFRLLPPCRLGTQPKGIGDFKFVKFKGKFNNLVPPRHSAERHWRLRGAVPAAFCGGRGAA